MEIAEWDLCTKYVFVQRAKSHNCLYKSASVFYLQVRHVWSLRVDVFTKLLEGVTHNDVLVETNKTVKQTNVAIDSLSNTRLITN